MPASSAELTSLIVRGGYGYMSLAFPGLGVRDNGNVHGYGGCNSVVAFFLGVPFFTRLLLCPRA